MPINTGVIEATVDDVVIRIYYDPTGTFPDQPLINGPRGWCLDMTNPSGKVVRLVLRKYTPDGSVASEQRIQVGTGDPVTTGPASGRSRTAAQLAALGFTTRADVQSIAFEQ